MPKSAFRKPVVILAAVVAITSFSMPEIPGLKSVNFITETEAGVKSRSSRSKRKFRNGQSKRNFRGISNARRNDRIFFQRKRDIQRRNDRLLLENQLQSNRRSSTVLANPQFASPQTPVIINNGLGNRFNSGVFLKGNRRDRLFIQRREDIARRNDRLVLENEAQSLRRSGAVLADPSGPFSDALALDPREGVLTAGVGDSGTAGVVSRFSQPCPTKHNCGYRIYSNGTGPRIITPGVSAGNGLPEFDGISGPSIITPYD